MNTRSEEWRHKISLGLKKAHVEGRVPPRTRESIEKGATKLRGRKRPPEVVERMRQGLSKINLKGRIIPQEARIRISEGLKAKWANLPVAQKQERIARLRGIKHPSPSQEQRDRHSLMMRGRKPTSELVERRAASMRGRPQTHPWTRKGHQHGLHGALRSPENVVYEFHNLTDWVRHNPNLFDPEDVLWRTPSNGKGMPFCRASKGLNNLFGHGKHVNGSWKGWTVFSHTEQLTNQGEDLLDRVDATKNYPQAPEV